MAGPTESVEGASPRLSQVLARRTVIAVALVLILCVPFAVFAVISGEVAASSWAMLTGVVALISLMIGGRPLAFLAVGLLTALTPVAIVSGAVPVAGAALMAIMCLGVGTEHCPGAARGVAADPDLSRVCDHRPAAMERAHGGRPDQYLVPVVEHVVLRRRGAVGGAGFPAVVAEVEGAAELGAWLVLTVLAVTELGGVASVKKTLARVAGTVVGVVIAAILASVSGSEAVLLGIGLVLLVILLVIFLSPHSYLLYTVVLTPIVVLFTSTSIADVATTDEQRLGFTLIGGALVLLASGIALGLARYQQAHSPLAAAES